MASKKSESAEVRQFVVRRDGEKDIRFRGERVACVSTLSGYGPMEEWPVDRRYSLDLQRWRQLALYRTVGGSYVCHRINASNRDGEVDRHEAVVITGSEKVFDVGASGKAITKNLSAEERVVKFFGRDSLAKDLYEKAGIEDIEEVD